ncbi:hypothetical protein SeMB42_g04645 [Synchytrium endobioticum]|uniref:NF-X1-type domain-containing protein n=1 Tax=Synchytrium endobioticum TaxID=286115 RepID=A0A507CWZ7_9FUNG|nr:hypothetical protein SeMB42_g04645 [Synchytrium endobioticum]
MTCTEPVPICTGLCGKLLGCGHHCVQRCHVGECGSCENLLEVSCRCGSEIKRIPCGYAQRLQNGAIIPPLCDRLCNKPKTCRRREHRCHDICCDMDIHVCDALCNKLLKCRQHNCRMECGHVGTCMDCIDGVSFDELRCACGRTVLYPPIPCGTVTPTSTQPCPPCPYFTTRICACGKNTVKNVPCSRQVVPSCGRPCLKLIEACQHRCLRFCHTGECIDETHRCMAKCGHKRMICNHECNQNCHGTKYCRENKACQEVITQACPCGNKSNQVTCGAWSECQSNQAVSLACDDDCLAAERNKLLAEALGVTPKDEAAFSSLSAPPNPPTITPLSLNAPSSSKPTNAIAQVSDVYNGIEISETSLNVMLYDGDTRAVVAVSSPSISAVDVSWKLQELEHSIRERILDTHLGLKLELLKGVDGWKAVSKKKARKAKVVERTKDVEDSSDLLVAESKSSALPSTAPTVDVVKGSSSVDGKAASPPLHIPSADCWEDIVEEPL